MDKKSIRKNIKAQLEVSVAIVTRNRSSLLKEALESLALQTVKPLEILIIDNNSNDNTKYVVRNFKKKLPIRYIFEPKIGIPHARNRALNETRGKILAFIDDDCRAVSNWVEEIGKNHQYYPDAAAIQGSGVVLNPSSLVSAVSESLNRRWINSSLKASAKIDVLITMNASVKIKTVRKFKLKFDENFTKYFRGEDTDFAYQLMSRGLTVRYCPSIEVFYQARPNLWAFLKQRFNSGKLRAYLRYKWSGYPFIYQSSKKITTEAFEQIKWFLKPFYPYLLQVSGFVSSRGLLKESYRLAYENNLTLTKPIKTEKRLYLTAVLGKIKTENFQRTLEDLAKQKIKLREVIIDAENVIKIYGNFPFKITLITSDLVGYLNSVRSPSNVVVFLSDQSKIPEDWSQKVLEAHINLPEINFIQGRVVYEGNSRLQNLYRQLNFDEKFFLRSNEAIDFTEFFPVNLSIKTKVLADIEQIIDFVKSQPGFEFKTEEIIAGLFREKFPIAFVPNFKVVQEINDQSLVKLLKHEFAAGRSQKKVDYFKQVFLDNLTVEKKFTWSFFIPGFAWLLHPMLKKQIIIFPLLFILTIFLKASFEIGYKRQKQITSPANNQVRNTKLKADFMTIAVITRNRHMSLSRLLDSITRQSVNPLEILVIDNGSTDQTKNVVNHYRKVIPIRYVYEPKAGIPYARNKALKEASTQMLAFVDDDCIVPVNWTKTLIDAYYDYPNAGAIQGQSVSLPRIGQISFLAEYLRHGWFASNTKGGAQQYLRSFQEGTKAVDIDIVDTRNVLLNLKVLKACRIRFDESYQRGSDTDLGKQIKSKKQRIIFYPNMVAYHYERGSWGEFMVQVFNRGRSSEIIKGNWEERKPERDSLIKQLAIFINYCYINDRILEIPVLLPFFFTYFQAYNLGKFLIAKAENHDFSRG